MFAVYAIENSMLFDQALKAKFKPKTLNYHFFRQKNAWIIFQFTII